jgi:type I restriction enzyme M protein
LHGGVPEAEIRTHEGSFAAYGIRVDALFSATERTRGYRDFPPDGWETVADQIPALTTDKKEHLVKAFDEWWDRHVKHIVELPATGPGRVMETRRDLLESFVAALETLGVLDRYQLAGVVASWWGDVQYDIRTLAYHKFSGVVQGWLTTIEAAFDTEGEENVRDRQRLAAEKRRAREHSAVPRLVPGYLSALERAEARRADLDAQVKSATTKPTEDEDDADDDVSAEAPPDPAGLKKLKSDLAAAKSEVKRLEADFLNQLRDRVGQLGASDEELLVRQILKADLKKRLDAEFAAGPRMLADRYCTWANKYAVPLVDLEARRSVAEARFSTYLKDLGYV